MRPLCLSINEMLSSRCATISLRALKDSDVKWSVIRANMQNFGKSLYGALTYLIGAPLDDISLAEL